jgi:proline iminopeptidase
MSLLLKRLKPIINNFNNFSKLSIIRKMSNLYPEIEPYNTGMLPVSDIHQLYYEESGNKSGLPVVFLHGGPGGGTSGKDRRYFDPETYRIVLLDQRGAGKSTPSASLENNTTWDLVEDIEKIREHLNIDKWVVFGGSWGSTLSLVYAETHPTRVLALILRGIFTLRDEEIRWFYQHGAHYIYPDFWEKYLEPIPEAEHDDLVNAYHRRLTGDNEEEKLAAAKAWSTWECATCFLRVDQKSVAKAEGDKFALAFARIENHYFVNKGFFKSDGQVIEDAKIIAEHNIPVSIVQGRYDVVCPAKTAWDLKKNIPYADLHIIEDAGHSAGEVPIANKLVEFADYYRKLAKQ